MMLQQHTLHSICNQMEHTQEDRQNIVSNIKGMNQDVDLEEPTISKKPP